MPLFSVSCAFGGCHDGDTRSAGLFLGPNFVDGAPDLATQQAVHLSLLAPSTIAPALPRALPGDPARSFLLLKLEGCQNVSGLSCKGTLPGEPCGTSMPALSPPLPTSQLALITRWIAQGALGPSS